MVRVTRGITPTEVSYPPLSQFPPVQIQMLLQGSSEAGDEGFGNRPSFGPTNGALGFGPNTGHGRDSLEVVEHAKHPEESSACGAHEFLILHELRRVRFVLRARRCGCPLPAKTMMDCVRRNDFMPDQPFPRIIDGQKTRGKG